MNSNLKCKWCLITSLIISLITIALGGCLLYCYLKSNKSQNIFDIHLQSSNSTVDLQQEPKYDYIDFTPEKCRKNYVHNKTSFDDSKNFEKFPWVARLIQSHGDNEEILCGGALVRENLILTAASCLDDLSGKFYIQLGGDADNNYSDLVKLTSLKTIIHPDYNKINLDNDIALIKLNRRVKLSKTTDLICLESAASLPDLLTFVEFKSNFDVNRPEIIEDSFSTIDDSKCIYYYEEYKNMQNITEDAKEILNNNFCAIKSRDEIVFENEDEKRDNDTMKSTENKANIQRGLPIVTINDDINIATIHGLLSHSLVANVYTKIHPYKNWIMNNFL